MRIAFLTDRYPPDVAGGAEISLSTLVNALKQREGLDLRVVALSETADRVREEKVDGVPVTRVPSRYDHRFPMPHSHVVAPWAAIGRGTAGAAPSAAGKIFAGIRAHLVYFFKKTNASLGLKLRLFASNVLCYLFSKENIECLDEDFQFIVDTSAIRAALEAIKPDLVHADNSRSILRYAELSLPFPGIALVRDLKFICPRRIMIAHQGDRPCESCDFGCLETVPGIIRSFLQPILERNRAYRLRRLGQFKTVVTTSRYLQETMRREAGIESEVVPNMVGDTAAMDASRNSLQRRSAPPTLVVVGMLQKNKGVDFAIHIMPEVRKVFPDARLLIAGKGGYEPALRRIVADQHMEEFVEFTGFATGADLHQLYIDSDIVLCFTRWPEPFGRIPLEAGLFERPVIASRHGGFVETIVHGETGLLVGPGDAKAFLAAVVSLLSDLEKRRHMGEQARLRVLSNYTAAIPEKMLAVYSKTMK